MKYAFLRFRLFKSSNPSDPLFLKGGSFDLNKLGSEHVFQKEQAEARAHELNKENANLKYKCQMLDLENLSMIEH